VTNAELLTLLTCASTVPDVPPGWEIGECLGTWSIRYGIGSWDDEFVSATREEARAECWRRFCAAEPKWSAVLAGLLSADPVQQAARTLVRLFDRKPA
jgi:hypothetical protein